MSCLVPSFTPHQLTCGQQDAFLLVGFDLNNVVYQQMCLSVYDFTMEVINLFHRMALMITKLNCMWLFWSFNSLIGISTSCWEQEILSEHWLASMSPEEVCQCLRKFEWRHFPSIGHIHINLFIILHHHLFLYTPAHVWVCTYICIYKSE